MGPKRWMRALTAPVFALLLTSCGGGGGGDVGSLFPLWVPTDVQTADIDGDGRLDVITIAQLGSSMSDRVGHLVVRRQTAPGAFTAPGSYIVGGYPWKLAVKDVDGDGAPDLALVDAQPTVGSTKGAVWLLQQDPASPGAFLPARLLLETASSPHDIAIGDLNGDGAPDLVIDSNLAGEKGATLLLQNAGRRGSFLPPAPLALPGNATAATIGDIDGDGREDIVVRIVSSIVDHIAATALGVLSQQGDGTLSPWKELPSVQSGILSKLLAVSDVNGDGVDDIVEFFTPQSTDYRTGITTLVQDPSGGGFTRVDSSLAGIRGVDDAVVADLDGSGRPDVATVGFYPGGSALNILPQQDGTGVFHLTRSLPMPIPASRIAAGDLDADGLNDFIVLGGDNKVFWMRQSPTSPGTFMEPRFLN